ncbi:MAG: HAD family hydrolase [Deltaproteobacteria bacterium]|nr:HAD family hydrolase [Deltaproteobacteria bacterium]
MHRPIEIILCDADGTIISSGLRKTLLHGACQNPADTVSRLPKAGNPCNKSRLVCIHPLEMDKMCRDSELTEILHLCAERDYTMKIFGNGLNIAFCRPPQKRELPPYRILLAVGKGAPDQCLCMEYDDVFADTALFIQCLKRGVSVFLARNLADVATELKKEIRGVLFDLDGTLVDSFQAIEASYRYMFSRLGRNASGLTDVMRGTGRDLREILHHNLGPAEVDEGLRLFREQYREVCLKKTYPMPGAHSLLRKLEDSGLSLGAVTNKRGDYARELLAHLGMARHFKIILGAEDGFPPKPSSDMLSAALERIRLTPSQVVYVGDSPIDVEAGRRSGIDVYCLATGYHSPEELAAEKPRRVLSSPSELFNVLRECPYRVVPPWR